MAATLTLTCPSCGDSHELFLPQADVPDFRTRYEYQCPRTGGTITLDGRPDWWKTVDVRPTDAVTVIEVGPRA